MSSLAHLPISGKPDFVITRQLDGDKYDAVSSRLDQIDGALHMLLLAVNNPGTTPSMDILSCAISGASFLLGQAKSSFDAMVVGGVQ